MRKQTAPLDRIARISSPIGDPARERRIDIAYRAYVLKALQRFHLEGRAEWTRVVGFHLMDRTATET
jgi:hypothetical protein